MEEEKNMTGWNAITDTFLKLYPEQTEPRHFAPLFSYRLGGDPLDNISVYESDDFFHFVSYGLSELYQKESEDKEYSGYGFEFTLKLKKTSLNNVQNELECICGILQSLAEETFSNGSIFKPYEYIYTGQTNGIDSEGVSNITGFVTILDEAGEIITPNGKLQFVQLVGVTNNELQQIMKKRLSVQELISQLGHSMTDYKRESIV
ncbi:suppressor of fused domain protein [Phocaeicola dorei]|jgi:hypothetical protein|uniref:suppressor of fused domain protein n=1 Tax=Phocaeicola dorei TaxID=357276 RepID=UPI00147808EB|nr:suppressor of fused domain protein [Phocaeicola dorei]MBS6469626.1 suppressor of fused domain protein [Bacteroides sp.]QJR64829.1 suppressor of fused domain protein [Phocaeicola dorei]QJR69094.1 suppressor of fused domain protein [Phocaeicola dorei]QJR73425.1 suppressor of fused domain protein [Phocaeicola dorei]